MRIHKNNLSRKLSKLRRLLCAEDTIEAIGEGSSYWKSRMSSTHVVYDKEIKELTKKTPGSK